MQNPRLGRGVPFFAPLPTNFDLSGCLILVVGVGAHDDPAVKCCIFKAHLGEIAALHAGRRGAAPYSAMK